MGGRYRNDRDKILRAVANMERHERNGRIRSINGSMVGRADDGKLVNMGSRDETISFLTHKSSPKNW